MISCVADETQVLTSIDRSSWQDKVLLEDFNRLKQEVAADIKSGEKHRAIDRIDSYHRSQSAVNAAVNSEAVRQNLSEDVKELREIVNETFAGAPAAVAQKQKSTAKSLQYQGYSGRRMQSSIPR
jgi:Ca-activated chloride channel family protein